ncbi:MAG: HAD hydrolase-like protein, partial [Cyanobacteria bacterium REEB65]|nr:HAD hydrolase-like protein [Cyanobacteria bacterium REEB65]
RDVFGTTGPIVGWNFGGKTDPQLVTELMTAAGIAIETIESRMTAVFSRYLGYLEGALAPALTTLKPGVRQLLEILASRDDVLVGLLTGNLAGGAELKLRSADLCHYFAPGREHFALGAFGSDHARRNCLPAIAVDRAWALTGHRYSGKSIVIIGDTRHDVACGQAAQARTIAVATGSSSYDELAECRPDCLLDDLADAEAALLAILS